MKYAGEELNAVHTSITEFLNAHNLDEKLDEEEDVRLNYLVRQICHKHEKTLEKTSTEIGEYYQKQIDLYTKDLAESQKLARELADKNEKLAQVWSYYSTLIPTVSNNDEQRQALHHLTYYALNNLAPNGWDF